MESRHVLAVLLFGSFLFCFLLVFGWTDGRPTTRVWSCMEAINTYQYREVNGNLLENLIKVCHEDGIDLNGNVFDFGFLKRHLLKFSCPKSWEYLSAPKPLVALASYPGSGNTWTRELIETTTGVHTGSIYEDWNFVGSKLCPTRGQIYIVKTHLMSSKATHHPDCHKMGVSNLKFSKAILILRNPYNALLAEFNRQNAVKPPGSTFFNPGEGLAPESLYRTEKWQTFVMKEADNWKRMALHWLDRFDGPSYALVYDKVKENTLSEMYSLTKFLNITVSFNSLYCLSSNKTGNYHRVKPTWLTKANLYDKKLSKIVNSAIEDLNAMVGFRKNITDVLHSFLLPVD